MNDNDWDRARNVLCIRLDNMGDVLMTTPAIRALRHSLPGRRITLLASAGGAAGAAFMPEIDDVITYASPWMKSSAGADADADFALVQALRAHRFDAAVIFTSYSQSPLPAALLCHLAHIPLRLAHCHENPYHLLSHWVPDPEPHDTVRHEVRRQLDLVATVGCSAGDERLSFRVTQDDAAWARRHLQAIGIDLARPWVLMHPGASAPSRRYPPALWAEAANRIAAELQCPLVFSGGAEEAQLVDTIRATLAHPSYSMAGKLDLGKFAAVLAQAPLLVANNTGPAHLAAALGTPVVDLYALTNPQHTPWQVPSRVLYHDVPCAMCYKSICPKGHHDCLARLSPVRVAREAIALLHETWRGAQDRLPVAARVAPARRTDQGWQPLFAQRPPGARKTGPLEPLTPVVVRSPVASPGVPTPGVATPGIVPGRSKGRFHR
jgi:lipopolysaccharide heptosyltransferase II